MMRLDVSPMVKRFIPGLARLPISAFFAMITPENGAVIAIFAAFPVALSRRIEAVPREISH